MQKGIHSSNLNQSSGSHNSSRLASFNWSKSSMEIDDDYESIPVIEEEPSPQPLQPLKRLKKQQRATELLSSWPPQSGSDETLIDLPMVDFPPIEALEDAAPTKTKTLDSYLDVDSNESLSYPIETQMRSEGNEGFDLGFDDEVQFKENRKETKRALDFDDEKEEDLGELEKKGSSEGDSCEEKDAAKNESITINKKRSKRVKSDGFSDDMEHKPKDSGKRRQEKERRTYLKQLHVESQRILRETSEAAFKPIPVVSKPISSVLQKIRQRKLELSKRNMFLSGKNASVEDIVDAQRDDAMDLELKSRSVIESKGGLTKVLEEDSFLNPDDTFATDALDTDKITESAVPLGNEIIPMEKFPSEESPPVFRAPINDTEDLFGDSETQDCRYELPVDLQDSRSDDVPKPLLLAMNLKFDSALSQDSSSEEENDKENIDPILHRGDCDSTFPRGAPVEAFLDDEAEEDGSDNERFQEDEEDEDMEDSEELNDIIATNYTEKPIDYDRRNKLHQMWLEQQDAAGTDNLLQRLKVVSKPEDILLGEEEGASEDREDYNHEDVEPKSSARMTSKKAKEIITQMFLEKDDSFFSDEDEEIERRHVKQQLLLRTEEQGTLISPMEDESSREVFRLIKKLNIVPENKKKAKATSFHASLLEGGSSKSFSKSSFLGRSSNHPLPSSHKQGSGTARSFIFGRDDSNSRSSFSISDDSSDTISKENQHTRAAAARLACSQAKFSSQNRYTSVARASGASLFEILKRASVQSAACRSDDPVDLSNVLATFKVPKKQVKVEGRT